MAVLPEGSVAVGRRRLLVLDRYSRQHEYMDM